MKKHLDFSIELHRIEQFLEKANNFWKKARWNQEEQESYNFSCLLNGFLDREVDPYNYCEV